MGTLRIDNQSSSDTAAQRAGFGPPPTYPVVDPSAILAGAYRDYAVPAGTYHVGIAFGIGTTAEYSSQIVTDGNVTTVTLT